MSPRLLPACVVLLLFCGAAQAQTSAAFEDLRRLLQPRQSVIVIDVTGRQVRGRLVEITVNGIAVERSGSAGHDVYRFPRQDVRQINGAADPLWDGTLIGAASGFFGGCVGGYTTFDSDAFNILTKDATDACLLAGIVSAGIGAGGGAVIDWLRGRHGKPVYKVGRLGLTPSLRPDQAALNVALRW